MPTQEKNTMPPSDIGSIIMNPKHRIVAYTIFALVSSIVSNTAIYLMATQVPFPPILVGAMAVIGNLAVPFAAIAVANAPKKVTPEVVPAPVDSSIPLFTVNN